MRFFRPKWREVGIHERSDPTNPVTRFENMIGSMGWFQCAHNIFWPSRLSESSMSHHQVLASPYGGFVALISVLDNYAANRK